MTEASGERTPEQHAAVRRRALPVAACAVIVGLLGLLLLVMRSVQEGMPPALFGVNLSFCAIMMGIGILFYARRTSGTGVAAVLSVLAILVGIGGTFLYFRQGITWRVAMEQREMGNARAISVEARKWAEEHGGAYPASLTVLLDAGRLKPEQLHSPYGSEQAVEMQKKMPPEKFVEWLKGPEHCDYLYFGGDLRLPGAAGTQAATMVSTAPATQPGVLPASIIVACGKDPIMRKWITVVYADGRTEFLDWSRAEDALAKSDEGRKKLGLPAIERPAAVRKAEEVERRKE